MSQSIHSIFVTEYLFMPDDKIGKFHIIDKSLKDKLTETAIEIDFACEDNRRRENVVKLLKRLNEKDYANELEKTFAYFFPHTTAAAIGLLEQMQIMLDLGE